MQFVHGEDICNAGAGRQALRTAFCKIPVVLSGFLNYLENYETTIL